MCLLLFPNSPVGYLSPCVVYPTLSIGNVSRYVTRETAPAAEVLQRGTRILSACLQDEAHADVFLIIKYSTCRYVERTYPVPSAGVNNYLIQREAHTV
jgi:hypothetical protein